MLLDGFSRGAIACGYLGLHDDETSALWTALFAYSHFDGGIKTWPYPPPTVPAPLPPPAPRQPPVFICAEGTKPKKPKKSLRRCPKPYDLPVHRFRNHNDAWILRPSPAR